MQKFNEIEGNICDLENEKFFPGKIIVKNGKIFRVGRTGRKYKGYILPGFIDSHCHIESSFLSPPLFAALAISHGTVSAVADCHEIANVLGKKGILWMLKTAKISPFNFFWALPSCVPATKFETTPQKIAPSHVSSFLKRREFVALGEMMNFPGVINGDKEVMAKIMASKKAGKPVDGHCPGLSGENLEKYFMAGISTDHECVSLEEAVEKQKLGMLIQIREGSAAKNLKNLIGLNYDRACLVTDDLEVKDLIEGHLNKVVKKAIKLGVPFFKAIKMTTRIPAKHYGLNFGEIKIGKGAHLVEFYNLNNFKPRRVWISGKLVFEDGKILFPVKTLKLATVIKLKPKIKRDFEVEDIKIGDRIKVIKIIPGQIITKKAIVSYGQKDILKIAVVNRYGKEYIGLGFVKGFGLKDGALASSVSHDSHNLICVGTNNRDMAKAVNLLRKSGGFVFVSGAKEFRVKLPLAGLMSNEFPAKLAEDIGKIEKAVKKAGCKLGNPLSQLSFLALLVIPELKISDRGLFDVGEFKFVRGIVDKLS